MIKIRYILSSRFRFRCDILNCPSKKLSSSTYTWNELVESNLLARSLVFLVCRAWFEPTVAVNPNNALRQITIATLGYSPTNSIYCTPSIGFAFSVPSHTHLFYHLWPYTTTLWCPLQNHLGLVLIGFRTKPDHS